MPDVKNWFISLWGQTKEGLREEIGKQTEQKDKRIFGSSLLHGDTVESYNSLSDVATSKDLAKVHEKFEKVKFEWTLSGCLTNP